jgi:hypothetical protein
MENETKNELITEGWVDVDQKLPEKSMKVQWLSERSIMDFIFTIKKSLEHGI